MSDHFFLYLPKFACALPTTLNIDISTTKWTPSHLNYKHTKQFFQGHRGNNSDALVVISSPCSGISNSKISICGHPLNCQILLHCEINVVFILTLCEFELYQWRMYGCAEGKFRSDTYFEVAVFKTALGNN